MGRKGRKNWNFNKNKVNKNTPPDQGLTSNDTPNNEAVAQSPLPQLPGNYFTFLPTSTNRNWVTQTCRELNENYNCNIPVNGFITNQFQGVGNLYRQDLARPNSRNMGGGGNCLFHSISHLLTGSPDYHSVFRRACVQKYFETINIIDEKYQQHYEARGVQNLQIDPIQRETLHVEGQFAGDLALFLLASLLNCEIVVISVSNHIGHIVHPPIFRERQHDPSPYKIYLKFFAAGYHYEPIFSFGAVDESNYMEQSTSKTNGNPRPFFQNRETATREKHNKKMSFVDPTKINEKMEETLDKIQITGFQTDFPEAKRHREFTSFCNSQKCLVFYTVNDSVEQKITLNNLLQRGFPKKNTTEQFEFFSYIRFRKFDKHMKSLTNETVFLDVLRKINIYYRQNKEVVKNEGLQSFKGPQNYQDRLDDAKFHYYGRGVYKYYRLKTLHKIIEDDYGPVRLAEFKCNPMCDFITTADFNTLLDKVNRHLQMMKTVRENPSCITPFAGPQCPYRDRQNLERLNYDVSFVRRKENIQENTDTPDISSTNPDIVSTDEEEPGIPQSFIRQCNICHKYRLVDQRAAMKYALGYIEYENNNCIRIQFSCNSLMDTDCETPSDLEIISDASDFPDQCVILHTQNTRNMLHCQPPITGILVEKDTESSVPGSNIFKTTTLKSFGETLDSFKKIFAISEITAIKYESNRSITLGNFQTRRFRSIHKNTISNLHAYKCVITIPRQAKVCTPWHDDKTIDFENYNLKLKVKYLTAVRNIHCVSDNLKRLRCVKCNRETVGLENVNDISAKADGDILCIDDVDLLTVIKKSVYLRKSVKLNPKFNCTDLYKSTATYAEGVCEECVSYYNIQNNRVIPKVNPTTFYRNQDNENNTDNEYMQTDQPENYINPYGIENLVSLDVFNDNAYAAFVRTLTRAEIMVLSRLHFCITILRDRINKIPWSIGGTIVFARKGCVIITQQLPWTDFKEFPLIVVVHDLGNNNIVEATIDMNKLRRARWFMEQVKKCPVYGDKRPQYRYCAEGLFSGEKMRTLMDVQLQGKDKGVPKDIRKVCVNQLEKREKLPLKLDEFQNWIHSGYEFGSSLCESYKLDLIENKEDDKIKNIAHSLWEDIRDFIKSNQTENSDEGVEIYVKDIVEYAFKAGYFEPNTGTVSSNSSVCFDFKYVISEELSMLSTESSNDSGEPLGMCANLYHIDGNPDRIMQEGLQKTALKRVPFPQFDIENPIPENMIGYLPMAFPQLFLSGDGCLHQARPVAIFDPQHKKHDEQKYMLWLQQQPETNLIPEMIFLISNKNKRIEGYECGRLAVNRYKKNKSDLPTIEELKNDPKKAEALASSLMQFKSTLTDSCFYWKLQRDKMIGNQRDLEDVAPWRPRKYPIYPKDFITRNTPHYHGPGIHRLMPGSEKFSNIDSQEKAEQYFKERMKNVLKYPQIITMWSAFFAEISTNYYTNLRFDTDFYVSRFEWGKSSNPHYHELTYSKSLSQENFEKLEQLYNLLEKLSQQALSQGSALTDPEIQSSITAQVVSAWDSVKNEYMDKMSKYYSQWNPGKTRDGKKDTYDFRQKMDRKYLISNLNMCEIIHKALKTGDFNVIDDIFVRVLNTFCRHPQHSGKDGISVTKKDYCCTVVQKLDKVAMERREEETGKKSNKIYRPILKCKRRFPREQRQTSEIYRDPFNKKLTQLGQPCNDIWLNGGDPFSTLLWLHNTDDKAVVPPQFVKPPLIDWTKCSESPTTLPSLILHEGAWELAAAYLNKYIGKAPVVPNAPEEILLAAHETCNPNDQITVGDVAKVFNAITLKTNTCLFNALHVNYGFPLVITNMESNSINTEGLNLIKADFCESDSNDYTYSMLRRFDARLGNPDDMILKDVKPCEFQKEMCVQEFFDKFDVSEVKGKLKILRRKEIKAGRYQFVRSTPGATTSFANPNSKNYWRYCKNMIFYRKNIWSTEQLLQNSEANIDNMEQYWIDLFNNSFPKGTGLPKYAQRWYRHYHKDEFDAFLSSDSSDDDECIQNNPQANDMQNQTQSSVSKQNIQGNPLAKNVHERFFQDDMDKIRNPVDPLHFDQEQDPDRGIESLANPDNIDVHSWLKGNTIPSHGKILTGLQRLREIKVASSNFEGGVLRGKQQLVRDLIFNYVEKSLKFANGEISEAPKPLRLVVMGKPGAGKSFTIKMTLSDLQNLFPDDKEWEKYIKTTAPSGAAAFQLGFGTRTCHNRFCLKVIYVNDLLSDAELASFIQDMGPTVKLIIFDEFSMLSREIFARAMNRLREAGHQCDESGVLANIGFVFVGDPAQILPVGGRFLWSPSCSDKKSAEHIQEFRTQMLLKPLTKLKNYHKWAEYDKVNKLNKDDNVLKMESQFNFIACYGHYEAVYLDEVHRKLTDDPISTKWVDEVLPNFRYGNVTYADIKFLHDHSATLEEKQNDPAWKNESILMGYHYYNPDNPSRPNVQSENAIIILDLYSKYKKPILHFTPYHEPIDQRHKLKSVSAKEFQNLQSSLYFFEGVSVMLLTNICPPLNLFNGAIHKYVGPLYLNKVCEVKEKSDKIRKCVKNGFFVEPLPVRGTPFHQIPIGSALLRVDGIHPPVLPSNNKEITCVIEMPTKPPSLPEYQVIEVDQFEKCGGPNILGLDFTKNMVPIPLVRNERSKTGKFATRINHPLELGNSYTSFKAQGATLERATIRNKGFHNVGGVTLAAISRTKSPKHNYFYPNEFPTTCDIKMQRLDKQVLSAECCERMVRVIAAKTFRHSCTTHDNRYGSYWTEAENLIADIIHNIWYNGKISRDETVNHVLSGLQDVSKEQVELVYDRMIETDEYFLQQNPPTITKKEIEELLAYKDKRSRKRPLNQTHGDLQNAKKKKGSNAVGKTSIRTVTRSSTRKKSDGKKG